MFKIRFISKIKESKIYKSFRRLRFLLHLKPNYRNFKKFVIHYFGGLYNRIDEHHLLLLSGGLAFSLFVCIIPLTLILFWILGNFLDSAEVAVQVNTLIDTIIPYDEYAEFVKNVIYQRITEVVEFKNVAGIIGIAGLFIAASGFFSSIRTILNKVFGTDIDINYFLGKLRDFALIISVIMVFLLTTLSFPLLEVLRSLTDEIPYLEFLQHGIFKSLFTAIISLSIIWFLFLIMYITIPIKKIRKRSALVGALWAAILWEAAKQLFGYYINNFPTWGRIYGTYALLVVVAFWIYYSAAVFIIGAEIGKLFDERVDERHKQPEETNNTVNTDT